MLCEFANRFPKDLADLLERDRNLTRNFREETATDLLMMGLTPLEPLGVQVDFPDEPVTGADMDWIYAAPHEVGGGKYLRLLIQAKRSKRATLKDGSFYWYYDHLDHGTPKGSQAKTLVDYAGTKPDGMDTLPLYFFYHPQSALEPAKGTLPPVEGVNVRFARDVLRTVTGGCKRKEKKISYWRDGFLSLSDLLCWPIVGEPRPSPKPGRPATEFLLSRELLEITYPSVAFHPDLIAERINSIRTETEQAGDAEEMVRSSRGIPDHIQRAIKGELKQEDRAALKRPRVIFSTALTNENPRFEWARAAVSRRRGSQS